MDKMTKTQIGLVRKWKMSQLDMKTMSKHRSARSKLISSCRIDQFSILLILFNWLAALVENLILYRSLFVSFPFFSHLIIPF